MYTLARKPVWYDEAVSISHAEKSLTAYLTSSRVNYKPVFFLLLNGWIHFFGEDPFALRLFSVIWGVLSVLLLYRIGSLIFTNSTGLTSAFLLSISVFHIFHCQQIRHFSFLVFLVLCSVLFFFQFIKKNNNLSLIFLIIVNMLIIFTHPYGFSIIIFEAFYFVLYGPNLTKKKWIVSQVILMLSAVSWALLPNKGAIKEMTWWITAPDFRSLIETVNTFAYGGPRYGLDDFRIWGGKEYWMQDMPSYKKMADLASVLTALYLFLIFKGVFSKAKGDKAKTVFLLLWCIAPIAPVFFMAKIGIFQAFAIKHFIIALPAFLMLVAKGIMTFGRKTATLLLAGIAIFNILPLKVMYTNYFCTDWKSSTEYIKSSIRQGDAILIYTLAELVPFMYYFRDTKPSLADIDIYGREIDHRYYDTFLLEESGVMISGIKQSGFGDSHIRSEQDFLQKAKENHFDTYPAVWLMVSRWTEPNAQKVISQYFKSNFSLKECRHFQGVWVCKFSH